MIIESNGIFTQEIIDIAVLLYRMNELMEYMDLAIKWRNDDE